MGKQKFLTIKIVSTFGPILWCSAAFAQTEGAPEDPAPTTTTTSDSSGTTIVVQPQTSTVTRETTVTPWGVPNQPPDPGEGGTYGFDLQGAGSTPTVRGGENSSYVLSNRSVSVPDYHTVKRGDTLWDLCDRYYENPYSWPRIWSYNPQVENPHWIYPGDRLRMRQVTMGGSQPTSNSGFVSRSSFVPAGTVFLRDRGYVGDEKKEVWGQLVGSSEDQFLLSDGDQAYVQIGEDHDVRIGQELSIFRRLRKPESGKSKGYIVAIKGTVRVTEWDEDNRMARVDITESLDVIERGDKIGPLGRRFDVVPPVPNDREIWARISAAVEPRELIGQHQVVFIDKGSAEGLRPGNRLFVVDKGDRWRASVRYGRRMAAHRMDYRLRKAEVERAPDTGRGKDFPTEVIGEIRVLRTREHTSICVVTYTEYELEAGALLVARRGY